jgi:ABC-2 type transport system permease protein
MPMTHALSALRKSILSGAGFDQIGHDLTFLLVFTIVVWPIGVWAFKTALHRSQVDGSLSHY